MLDLKKNVERKNQFPGTKTRGDSAGVLNIIKGSKRMIFNKAIKFPGGVQGIIYKMKILLERENGIKKIIKLFPC